MDKDRYGLAFTKCTALMAAVLSGLMSYITKTDRDIRALMNIHMHTNINTNTSALSALMSKEEAERRDK